MSSHTTQDTDGHQNWYRTLGLIMKYLAGVSSFSAPHLFADPERLIALFEADLLFLPDSKEPIQEARLRISRSGKDAESVLIESIRSIINPAIAGHLDQLMQDRALVDRYLRSVLGIHRVTFYTQAHGVLIPDHHHPLLPESELVAGPWYALGENSLLRRNPWLMPWGARLRLERDLLEQEHHGPVTTAERVLAQAIKLSPREQEGDFVLISEGEYYFHAFERWLRYGHPREIRDLPEAGLGLTRQTVATRRLVDVRNWLEAAFYAEIGFQLGDNTLAQAFSHLNEITVTDIRQRLPLMAPLHRDHCVARYVESVGEQVIRGSKPTPLLLDPKRGDTLVQGLAAFINSNARADETQEEFTRRIRMAVDADIFGCKNFNGLLFEYHLPERQVYHSGVRGVAHISTNLDLLDNWEKYRTRVEEMRTLLTLLGTYNQNVALRSVSTSDQQLNVVATYVRLLHALPEDSSCIQILKEGLTELGEVSSDSTVKKAASAYLARASQMPKVVHEATLANMEHVAGKKGGAEEDFELRSKIETTWGDKVLRVMRANGLLFPSSFCNAVPWGIELVVPESLSHVLLVLLLNAAEAAGQEGRVTIEIEEGERVVRIINTDSASCDTDTDRWFRPGFTSKDADRHLGLGLTSAWKIVHAYGGRIWIEHRKSEVTVSLTLPGVV